MDAETISMFFMAGVFVGAIAVRAVGRSPTRRNYVLLRMHDGDRVKKPVEWFGSRAYAAPYLPDTRCLLLPGGKVDGKSYVCGWEPCDERMSEHYRLPQA